MITANVTNTKVSCEKIKMKVGCDAAADQLGGKTSEGGNDRNRFSSTAGDPGVDQQPVSWSSILSFLEFYPEFPGILT